MEVSYFVPEVRLFHHAYDILPFFPVPVLQCFRPQVGVLMYWWLKALCLRIKVNLSLIGEAQ
ncbi:Uncharacterised protein [Segatella copri]|nr:Uncharacterised protein [Segatella copri]